jgi:chloride channel 3/4/5
VSLIGIFMALVAVAIDMSVATVAGLKFGYCTLNPLLSREACCRLAGKEGELGNCAEFELWGKQDFGRQFGIYVGWAVAFGVISSGVTMLSRRELPAVSPGLGDGHAVVEREGENLNGGVPVEEREGEYHHGERTKVETKSLYMSAGSGIPEIKVRAQYSRDT